MAPSSRWGLIGQCQERVHEVFPLTLESVDVQVSVRGFVAKVSVCQTYHNVTNYALEVDYRIPVDEGAAVYKFEAVVNGRKITAQIMEKKKAEGIYKEAVQAGYTAVLAREDNLTSDILNLALGNLPPGKKAELQLSMLMELKVQTDGAVNFTLPTVLNPRYCPADVTPDQHTRSVTRSYVQEVIIVSASYEFSIQAKVHGGHEISRIISHSDALHVNIKDNAMSAEVGMVGRFQPDHDWSMLLYYSNPYKSHIIRETGDRSSTGLMKDDLIMVNLHPEIPQESYSNKNEVIFVVDRSGSMRGHKIQSARVTLLLFLKSLPIGCYFNVISFGNTYSLLFEKGSEVYTESTLQKACKLQQEMEADMGGTEILNPFKQIYSIPPKPGYARQIILLSDGEVWNVDQVKQLVSRHAHETRVFTVGIGQGASTALIKGVANAGRGRSEMVYQQDKLQLKVMGLVKSMLQETVQEVNVNVEVDPPCGIKLVPKVPPIIFGGQHLILYTRVPSATTVKNVNIRGVVGEKQLSVCVEGSKIVTIHDEEMTLHRLAARSQINQWQIDDEEDVAEDMITLSLASGVVSRRTALVGVDQEMSPVISASSQDSSGLKFGSGSMWQNCNYGSTSTSMLCSASMFGGKQGGPFVMSTPGPQSRGIQAFNFSGQQDRKSSGPVFGSRSSSMMQGGPQMMLQPSSAHSSFSSQRQRESSGPVFGSGGMCPSAPMFGSGGASMGFGSSSASMGFGSSSASVGFGSSSASMVGGMQEGPPMMQGGPHLMLQSETRPLSFSSQQQRFSMCSNTPTFGVGVSCDSAPTAHMRTCSLQRRSLKPDQVAADSSNEDNSAFTLDKNAKSEDILMAVVNLQRFDGSWTLTDVAKLTSLPLKHLHDANISKNEVAWATALVLALLEKKFSSEKDEWVLLANKARSYILLCGEDVNTLLTSARLIITD